MDCKEFLELDDSYCQACGSEIKIKNTSSAINKIRYDGKIFEAEFTDTVGKDVTETFGKIFMENQRSKNEKLVVGSSGINSDNDVETVDIEAEVLNNTEQSKETSSNTKGSNVKDLFREKDGKLALLETRIKASDKTDYGMRLTYLTVLYHKAIGIDTVDKSKILDLLKYCGVYYSSYRKAFAKAKAHFIVDSGKVEFRPAGLEKASKILEEVFNDNVKGKWGLGDLVITSKNTTSSKSTTDSGKTSKPSSKIIQAEKFDAHNKKKTLKELFDEKKPGKSTTDRIVTIGYYLNYILKQTGFTDGNIDYAYRVLKLDKRPRHLRQVITNIKNENALIEVGDADKSWRLSRNGEIYVEEELPKK
ncbi:hypothetical protein DN53_00295 [Flagellimonas olearia]|uniref:Uncharacterized protein n=1 Tax=Flagellimonas olearia TaxID=552546 RepID=A0A444VPH1_9FLAO|nr:hypothetical protein DN53_00295 [Allomuricauda olearia]